MAVVDNHLLLRAGAVQILSSCPDLEILAQGASAKEAVAIADRFAPAVMVLDISIPDGGLEALEAKALHDEPVSEAECAKPVRSGRPVAPPVNALGVANEQSTTEV